MRSESTVPICVDLTGGALNIWPLQPAAAERVQATSSGGSAIDITHGFVDPSTSRNAGHVYAITNNLDGTRSQTFSYDQLNRITSALTTSAHATSPAHC